MESYADKVQTHAANEAAKCPRKARNTQEPVMKHLEDVGRDLVIVEESMHVSIVLRKGEKLGLSLQPNSLRVTSLDKQGVAYQQG